MKGAKFEHSNVQNILHKCLTTRRACKARGTDSPDVRSKTQQEGNGLSRSLPFALLIP